MDDAVAGDAFSTTVTSMDQAPGLLITQCRGGGERSERKKFFGLAPARIQMGPNGSGLRDVP